MYCKLCVRACVAGVITHSITPISNTTVLWQQLTTTNWSYSVLETCFLISKILLCKKNTSVILQNSMIHRIDPVNVFGWCNYCKHIQKYIYRYQWISFAQISNHDQFCMILTHVFWPAMALRRLPVYMPCVRDACWYLWTACVCVCSWEWGEWLRACPGEL